ncbi:predicted protein [Nematostella vectensis]|uniref:Uncharacterized protein n=1 Tax=Nematostella vectensis TaxID=45351 RepID=A7RX90_NEMVE|nr:uncharacterized protein LOC5515938 [Nematostella vectensis]EDO43989.1 predicted protein [Nematostella vectensis]|eukprot:XP_001636052.1 predicted protein [Nematostella vectensis]
MPRHSREDLAYFEPASRKCKGPEDTACVLCGEMVKDWYDDIADYDFNKGVGKDRWAVVVYPGSVAQNHGVGDGYRGQPSNQVFYTVAIYKLSGNQGTKGD